MVRAITSCGRFHVEMPFKVDRSNDGQRAVFEVSGRIGAEALKDLRTAIEYAPGNVLDLRHVTLVDMEAVQFLISCEKRGLELRNCSPFVREWILREQQG